jgi:hypothetical protein
VARVLEATIERNGENRLAAEQQALPGALDAQLEEKRCGGTPMAAVNRCEK